MEIRCSTYTALLLCVGIFCSWGAVQSEEEGHILVELFEKGLDFGKDFLIKKAETSLVPMELPDIEKTVKIPLIGKVKMEASNINLFELNVTSSTVKTGDKGIIIDVSGATANLTTSWKYSYSTWLVKIEDKGEALIQVQGMELGLSILLNNDEGSLKLSVLECGCNVNDLSIVLDGGGVSWLYQGFVDAFQGTISSRIENAISKKVKEITESLNPILGSVPKEVSINNLAALNVTFIGDPVVSGSSLAVAIDGLVRTSNKIMVSRPSPQYLKGRFSCSNPYRMVSISVHENVLESAAFVYYVSDKMHWAVDRVPDQSLLNTAGWKSIAPHLYTLYPDADMNLNISVSSPPVMRIVQHEIDATIPLDVIINVLDAGEVIPVLCITVDIRGSASAEVSANALAGSVRLDEFTMFLKWSNVGDLHLDLLQSAISTLVKTVILPYVNSKLNEGFPLPIFHGYVFQNTQIEYSGSWMVVCSDVAPIKSLHSLAGPSVLPL